MSDTNVIELLLPMPNSKGLAKNHGAPWVNLAVGSNVSVDVDSAQKGIPKTVKTWKFPTQARKKYRIGGVSVEKIC